MEARDQRPDQQKPKQEGVLKKGGRAIARELVKETKTTLQWGLGGAVLGGLALGGIGLWKFGLTGMGLGLLAGGLIGGIAAALLYGFGSSLAEF